MAILPAAAHAQNYFTTRTVTVERWVEEWDDVSQRWVRIDAEPSIITTPEARAAIEPARSAAETADVSGLKMSSHASRYAAPAGQFGGGSALAQYGPFRVIDEKRAALVGPTNNMSPHYFDAMLRNFPQLEQLDMVEAPGTNDDIANLAVGRRIRAAGISTHVPNGGSVRSGAVELFLAGVERTMDEGAEFAVHSWLDSHGREPDDFAPDAAENMLYLDYYREMGMSDGGARDFYAMTNSVPHSSAKWLGADEMRYWLSAEHLAERSDVQRSRRIDIKIVGEELPQILQIIPANIERVYLDSALAFP
ncbi:MAG: alpha/beta hydrolase [Erythrobacter sp.]